jgi:hypothetical protein
VQRKCCWSFCLNHAIQMKRLCVRDGIWIAHRKVLTWRWNIAIVWILLLWTKLTCIVRKTFLTVHTHYENPCCATPSEQSEAKWFLKVGIIIWELTWDIVWAICFARGVSFPSILSTLGFYLSRWWIYTSLWIFEVSLLFRGFSFLKRHIFVKK